MKTKISIFLMMMGVFITSSSISQNVPSYVPTNGLVGWWPFNGNANDESGNNLDGTFSGGSGAVLPSLASDRFSNGSSAYFLPGQGAYMQLPSPTAGTITNAFSYSIWIKQEIVNDYLCVIEPTYSGKTLLISPNSSGIRAYDGNSFYIYGADSVIGTYSWKNFTVVYDNQNISIYLNGVQIATGSTGATINYINDQTLVGNYSGSIYSYQGLVDDIGIWNRALTQQEITNLYNAPNPNTSIPIIGCPGAQLPTNVLNGLIGWWPFCGDAEDESGNGNDGAVNGATLTSDRFGNTNSAYEFDGSTAYIEVPNSSSLNIRTMFTISLWYNSDTIVSAPYNPQMISKERYLDGTGFQVGYGLNQLTSVALNNDPIGPPVCAPCNATLYGSPIIPNQWNHLVAVWNNDSLYLYQNSVKMAQGSGLLPNDSLLDSSMPLLIGKAFSSLTPPYPSNFKGQLDDIGIWNRALDSSEVVQLYQSGIGTQTIAGSCDTLIFNANITGFNPVTYANQIKVYPNPASDNLVIDCGSNYTGVNGHIIKITNTLGQVLYNSPINSQVTNIQLVPPQWVNGTYVVQFLNPQGVVLDTKSIIIQ